MKGPFPVVELFWEGARKPPLIPVCWGRFSRPAGGNRQPAQAGSASSSDLCHTSAHSGPREQGGTGCRAGWLCPCQVRRADMDALLQAPTQQKLVLQADVPDTVEGKGPAARWGASSCSK